MQMIVNIGMSFQIFMMGENLVASMKTEIN